ncbi:MAG: 4-hydroxybenzoate 3-monooxygenase [Myxococcales bacterium]|nr:4-hydroxybenzoate 3-monooxygenase [Myxococcales bacterium]
MRTQVGIIGGGPAGLLLARALHLAGVESVVFEHRNRERVEARIRAGVLERTTVEMLRRVGADERMNAHGVPHGGFALAFDGRSLRIDMQGLAGGHVMVWGQTQVTRDLIRLHLAAGGDIRYETAAVAVEGVDGDEPTIAYDDGGTKRTVTCDFVVGCDGYHGVSRKSVADRVRTFEKVYPFGWLGILSDVPPVHDELIYANHERGFALCSMRSPTRSRYYVQCETTDDVARWTDDMFWDELRRRLPEALAEQVVTGPRLEMSIAPLRSFVAEPMRVGRLFLAGDAAHIVPPTGAKGLNLAVGDVHYLSTALVAHYREAREDLLDAYSDTALRRVWDAIRFSWWFTSTMHRFDDPLQLQLQLAELRGLERSRARRTAMAESYLGMPYEEAP